jgi:hypothetical protein
VHIVIGGAGLLLARALAGAAPTADGRLRRRVIYGLIAINQTWDFPDRLSPEEAVGRSCQAHAAQAPGDALYILAGEPGKAGSGVAACVRGLHTVLRFAERWTRMTAPPNLPTVTPVLSKTTGRAGDPPRRTRPSGFGVKPQDAAGQLSPEPDS